MVIDTSKESININKIVCEREEIIFAEQDMIVPDSKPDIIGTISTSGNICIYKKELMDDKLKIDGCINAYIMYMSDSSDDNVRGININLDFTKIIDAPNCKENMILDMLAEINTIECNVINGRKINVKASINVKFKVYTNETVELLNDVLDNNDIKVLKSSINVNSLVGSGNTKAYVKETITIDNSDNLAEILKVNINMVDRDTKISYNKVLAKADAEIKVVYLTEDNRIVSCTNKIPIVGFIDIKDVSENNVCDTNFEIRNMVIKPNSIEDHSIYCEIEVEVSCMAYEEKNINILQDLYSPVQDLIYDKNEIMAISKKEKRSETCHISELINISEMEDNSIVDFDCKPKITNINKLNSKINYEGDIELKFILSNNNNNNQINTIRHSMPFEFSIDNIENGEKLNLNTEIEVGRNDFIIKQGGDVISDIDLIFNVGTYQSETVNIIDNIETEEDKNLENYSLIIYIVKPGDTLWTIAKNMRSTVEDIIRANGIEDENNIKVGEKLYIPRYVKYA